MVAAGNRTILNPGPTVAFGDKNFEVVNEFVYLGVLMTPVNYVGLEIQHSIQTVNSIQSAAYEHICGHLTCYLRQS
jgi:hypothetical protein